MKLFPKIDKDKRDPEAGWTYIETIISVTIVLILASTVGFMAIGQVGKAKSVTAKNQIEHFAMAMTSYYLDCGNYPMEDQGIYALWEEPSSDADGWNGPYLTKEPKKDPWKNDFEYIVPGPGGLPFGIRSFGADKMEGGEDENKDLSSWE